MPPRPAWYGWLYLLLVSAGAFGGSLLALLITGRLPIRRWSGCSSAAW